MGWMAPFRDPISHLEVFKTGNLNNYGGFSNERYDLLVDEIKRIEPGPQREAKIKLAQNILLEEAALVPLYHYVQNTAVAPRVHGFQSNPFGIIQFKELSIH
jgi:oligopeptide transport system substrate-binding protein